MTYAFSFDASACSGCKACQIACKDKNQLPAGVLWRRVYEVTGGSWQQLDGAWQTDVFAYNLSLACNHCVHPKCAGVCPVDAYVIRPDGIVHIDEAKCMGCGYCSWACPYGAPQYHPGLGHMTKCNFCFDHLEAGLPPACVAACPLRVLNIVTVDESSQSEGDQAHRPLWTIPAAEHPFPLPEFSRTQPHLAVKPHAGMMNDLKKTVSNREEVKPKTQKSEHALVAFTLLAQMAVGGFWSAQWMFPLLWNLLSSDTRVLRLIPTLVVGACLGLAGLFSFAHLGTKRNAWRALTHIRKSWLSREILFVGLFGAGWLASLLPFAWQTADFVRAAASMLGLGLIYSMAQVYRLPSMPAWNTRRTLIEFLVTACVLGQALMLNILIAQTRFTGIHADPFIQRNADILLILLGIEFGVWAWGKDAARHAVTRLRGGLIAAGIVGAGILSVVGQAGAGLVPVLFLLILAQEILGRWWFYEALNHRGLA